MNVLFRWVTAALITFGAVAPLQEQDSTKSPRTVVHLLDYLAQDYAGAVSAGKVTNPTEYQEQIEFARSALALSRESPELRGDSAILSGLAALNALIDRKASLAEVSQLALQLRQEVLARSGIAAAPATWPSLAHGRALYLRNCVQCHGPSGAGDGPAGASLDPKPKALATPASGAALSPFRAFNAIRLGIPKTGMAPWPQFDDQDVWDLAFYVTSMHMDGVDPGIPVSPGDLALASEHSDSELVALLPGDAQAKHEKLLSLRLHSSDGGPGGAGAGANANTLGIARRYLARAQAAYARGDAEDAKHDALLAYLEGIEPVEPRLRAGDAAFVSELEMRMALVRSGIEAKKPAADVNALIATASLNIDAAELRLSDHAGGPFVTAVLTSGILLREGFEAVLILVALLAVINASGEKRAARWVHAGWMAAVAVGLISWFFSGWLINFSGAQRELLEGITALLAVAVLLYVGFWLHSRTEIGRWRNFLDVQVKNALQGRNLWGLFLIAFMAVFREAFETVLFLRAITIEGGDASTRAMTVGVIISFAALFLLSWLLLRYSARIPIRRIFSISSALMAALAVILVGKGLHALQETGILGVSPTWWHWTSDLLGIYATWQTFIPQLVMVVVVWTMWHIGRRPARVAA
jgi:high-affinity iron transporter